MLRATTTYLLFLLTVVFLHAQKHSMYQYTVEDGLPSNYVYNVLEDDERYIWAYTENGIARFDGYNWKIYSAKDGLPSNDVYSLKKDKDGILWGQTSNREQFGIKNGKIILPVEKVSSAVAILFRDYVYFPSASYDRIDSLGNRQVLYRTTMDEGVTIVEVNDSMSIAVQVKANRQIYLSRILHGQERLLLHGDKIANTALSTQFMTLGGQDYHVVMLQKEAKLYSMSDESVISIDFKKHGVHHDNHLLAYTTQDGALRLESDKGYWIFDSNWQVSQSWSDEHFASNYDINGCRLDKGNNLWISTRSNGIFFVPSQKIKTSILTLGQPSANAFEGIVQTANETIFAANDDGSLVQLGEGKITKVFHTGDAKNRYAGMSYDREKDLITSNYRPGRITVTSNGKLRNLEQIAPYNYLKGHKEQEGPYNELFANALNSSKQILRVADYVFISNNYGTYIASPSDPYGELLFTFGNTPLRGQYPYYAIANDSLIRVDTVGAHESYFSDKYDVTDLLPLTGGTFLIGTQSSGLLLYDSSTDTISQVLATKFVKRIKAEGDHILVATYGGSYLLDERLNLLHHITSRDGLPSDEVNDLCLKENRLYSATVAGIGITTLPAERSKTDTLQDLSTINFRVDGRHVTSLDELTTGASTISIYHPLTHYTSNKHIIYEYRLLPHDVEWSQSTSPTTTLFGLEPNSYEFQIRAIDAYGGVHLAEPVSFSIPKPIYQQSWFHALLVFLLLGGIFSYYRFRDKERQKLFAKEQNLSLKMADLKLSALRSQMNPHFIFNALGAIQYYIQTHKVEEADRYLTQFAALMRMYLDSSKSTLITVAEEVRLLEHYLTLEKMRFEGLFTYEITIEKDIKIETTLVPPMMIQPFVENSVNHGLPLRTDGQGNIKVVFSMQQESLKVEIIDNGIGIDNAKKHKRKNHKSRGMSIIDEKLETLRHSGLADINITRSKTSTDTDFPGLTTTLIILVDR